VNRSYIKVFLALLAVFVVVCVIAALVLSALRKPTAADFKQFDLQRQAVDSSMNVYVPLFSDFASEYTNLHVEERPEAEKSEFKKQYFETFELERSANESRLNSMASSVVLKDPSVKSAYDTFEKRYSAVIEYYAQYTKNIASINEAVAGPCSQLSKLNVAKESYASDYTSAADACLEALAAAKKTSDQETNKLLSDVEKLIRTRRDKFAETIGTEGFEKNVRTMIAIVELLDINTDVKRIQDDYQAKSQATYSQLVKDANAANESLKNALKTHTAKGSDDGTNV
jgi:hypothetical protein